MYHLQPLHFRINTIVTVFIIALLLIMARLFYLQVSLSEHYTSRGQKNFLRIETTQSPRGNIIDCKGNLLATNRPVTHLYWNGTGNRMVSDTQQKKLLSLERILGITLINDPTVYPAINNAEKYYKQAAITKNVTLEQLSQIKELYPEDPNLVITTHFKRHYPYGVYASHILGYLGRQINMPLYGQTGLEKICDNILKGQEGTISKTINSFGRSITTKQLQQATIGNDIYITLDLDLQRIAEQSFPEQHSGAFLVMDPENGDLLATVSRPAFDPTVFLDKISSNQWQELQKNNPFLNRVLNPYPPGSIFKLITVGAALESKLLDPEKIWLCKGYVVFAKRKYWCHHRWGHGELNTIQAVAQSCNALFYEIGKKIDIDLLAQYATKFGLGQPTGILFHEYIGVVPSREWKLETKGEQWWPGETLSVTIGQSFLLSSPLQIARMIGSIFTGYLIKPRILQHEPIESIPLDVEQSTIDFIQRSMKYVVKRGTGKRVNVKDIKIYAKTSTAQTSDFSKRKLGTEFLEHAWFAAYVQYKHYKPLVFVILVENAGSSKVATLIAKQFLLAYKDLCAKDLV